MSQEPLERAARRLLDAKRILVTSHRGPDGDGVGSMVALAALMRENGKRATLFSSEPVPRNLRWMPHIRTWVRKLKAERRYDLTVVVDCGDEAMLGPGFPGREVSGDVLVLDHHAKARPFGDLFVSDPCAAATGVLIDRIARINGWPISKDAAVALWVALVSDTGSFRYSNTNGEALALAARLVEEHGVSPWSVAERLEESVPLRRYRLLSRVLSELEILFGGKVALMTVTQQTIAETEARWEDTEGLVNYARAIDGVECGVLLTPAKWGGTRVSVRSKGRVVDAGALCHGLGGGGHRGAAGCTLSADIGEARQTIEGALASALGVEPAPLSGAE